MYLFAINPNPSTSLYLSNSKSFSFGCSPHSPESTLVRCRFSQTGSSVPLVNKPLYRLSDIIEVKVAQSVYRSRGLEELIQRVKCAAHRECVGGVSSLYGKILIDGHQSEVLGGCPVISRGQHAGPVEVVRPEEYIASVFRGGDQSVGTG